jgi:hypothetical protein
MSAFLATNGWPFYVAGCCVAFTLAFAVFSGSPIRRDFKHVVKRGNHTEFFALLLASIAIFSWLAVAVIVVFVIAVRRRPWGPSA